MHRSAQVVYDLVATKKWHAFGWTLVGADSQLFLCVHMYIEVVKKKMQKKQT